MKKGSSQTGNRQQGGQIQSKLNFVPGLSLSFVSSVALSIDLQIQPASPLPLHHHHPSCEFFHQKMAKHALPPSTPSHPPPCPTSMSCPHPLTSSIRATTLPAVNSCSRRWWKLNARLSSPSVPISNPSANASGPTASSTSS